MAEETKKPDTPTLTTAAAAVTAAVSDAVASVKQAEKPVVEAEKPAVEADKAAVEVEATDDEKKITQQDSFKEETNVVGELPDTEKIAVDELKKLIQEACAKREFSSPPPPPPAPTPDPVEKKAEAVEEKASVPPPADAVAATEEKASVPPPADVVAVAEEVPKKTEEVVAALQTEAAPEMVEVKEKTVEAIKETASPTLPLPPPTAATPAADVVATLQTEATAEMVEAKEKTVEAIKETIVEVAPTTTAAATEVEPVAVDPEEVSIWGVPLLADERTDVILLKFLRASDFKVKEAFTMIRNTVRWRKEFGVDGLLNEDIGNDYEKVLFTHGYDKEGRVVCYNVFGEFQDKELYQNTFSDAEKREKFFKWLVQFLEKIIRDLDFSPEGISSIVLVNDLKNSPGHGKRDVSKIIDKFLAVLQDNYPEFVAKQVCINTSWWYVAYYWIYLTVFTPRSKSKFVFASPSKTPDTLFKYIAPEQVPIQYGGHSKTGVTEFSAADTITEVTIKPNTTHPIEFEFEFTEAKELVWELRVIGWDVTYGAEFSPSKEGGYTLNISKPKKVSHSDEPVITDTFKVSEAGKVVITIDNQSSKKKKLLYRSKVKAIV